MALGQAPDQASGPSDGSGSPGVCCKRLAEG